MVGLQDCCRAFSLFEPSIQAFLSKLPLHIPLLFLAKAPLGIQESTTFIHALLQNKWMVQSIHSLKESRACQQPVGGPHFPEVLPATWDEFWGWSKSHGMVWWNRRTCCVFLALKDYCKSQTTRTCQSYDWLVSPVLPFEWKGGVVKCQLAGNNNRAGQSGVLCPLPSQNIFPPLQRYLHFSLGSSDNRDRKNSSGGLPSGQSPACITFFKLLFRFAVQMSYNISLWQCVNYLLILTRTLNKIFF